MSDRVAVEFEEIRRDDYNKISKSIIKEFKLQPNSELEVGLDEIFQDFVKDGASLGLEWDVWSGYIVVAKKSRSKGFSKRYRKISHSKYRLNHQQEINPADILDSSHLRLKIQVKL